MRCRLRPLLFLTATLLAAVAAQTAAAHVQIRPAEAAPGDAVLFTLLVPNERSSPTTRIDLKVPPGVIAFSFQETPGWKRSEKAKANGSLDIVSWSGSLPPGEFATFSFLAATPDEEGVVSWPTVQTYTYAVVRWIGTPGSDEPAATTLITRKASPQNAGGEGADADSPPEQAETSPGTAESPAGAAAPVAAGGDSSSWLEIVALVVGAVGLAAGAFALVMVRRRSA